MVSCDSNDYGCQGGYMNMAWEYLEQNGVVSDSCFPYTAGSGTEAPCATKCADGSAWTKHKCVAGSVVNPKTVAAIQSEIFTNGPVEGAFTVYNDFFNYKSGVYVANTSTGVAGGHAIKVLGWGVENGLNYWLCANSWGTAWGMSGFFKIKQGTCAINDQIFACTPNVSAFEFM
jgi:cathepsin B